MLTGRPVDPTQGGHGVDWLSTPSTTVGAAAGHYVTSAFDLVHNYGYRTSFLARGGDLGIVGKTWGDGSADRIGVNNGRDKLTHLATYTSDGSVVRTLRTELAGQPSTLSVVHLGRPAAIGERYGFGSPQYAEAVSTLSRQIGRIQQSIADNPALTGHTVLIVTADSGGQGKQSADPTLLRDYRVPFLVTGPRRAGGVRPLRAQPAAEQARPRPGRLRRPPAGAQRLRRQPGDQGPGHAAGHRQHARPRPVVHGLRAVPIVSDP